MVAAPEGEEEINRSAILLNGKHLRVLHKTDVAPQ